MASISAARRYLQQLLTRAQYGVFGPVVDKQAWLKERRGDSAGVAIVRLGRWMLWGVGLGQRRVGRRYVGCIDDEVAVAWFIAARCTGDEHGGQVSHVLEAMEQFRQDLLAGEFDDPVDEFVIQLLQRHG